MFKKIINKIKNKFSRPEESFFKAYEAKTFRAELRFENPLRDIIKTG